MELNANKGSDVNAYKNFSITPGKYHFVVRGVEEGASLKKGTPFFELDLEVLAGQHRGDSLKTTLWATDKAVGRLVAFAMAVGVLKEGEQKGVEVLLDTVGRQFIGEVESQEYDRADGTKGSKADLSYAGIWPIGHEDVSEVEINQSAYNAMKEAEDNEPDDPGEGDWSDMKG